MSYIMQALQRSEQERRMGESPELPPIQPPDKTAENHRRWPIVLASLLALNLVLLSGVLIYFRPWEPARDEVMASTAGAVSNTVSASMAPIEKIRPSSTPLAPLVPPPRVAPLASQYTPPPQDASSKAPSPAPPVPQGKSGLPTAPPATTQEEAPQPTRVKEIEGIDMSVHVYSPDPKKRFVFINGQRYTEGDRLSNGAILKTINAKGIVVEREGRDEALLLEQ